MFQFSMKSKSTFSPLFVSCFFKMLVQCIGSGIGADLELIEGSHLSSLLIEIKLNIYKNYPLCDDSSAENRELLGVKSWSADFIFHHQVNSNRTQKTSAVQQVNLNQNNNNNNKNRDLIVISLIFPIKRLASKREFNQKIVSKYHQHCPIFVHDVVSKSENGSLKLELPQEFLEGEVKDSYFLQGWTRPSFYVFFINNSLKRGVEGESGLKPFYDFVETKYYKRIWNSAILIQPGSGFESEKEKEWKILQVDQNYEIKQKLVFVSRIEIEGSSSSSMTSIASMHSMPIPIFGDRGNKLRVNWNGNDLTVLVCAVCGGALGRFRKNGRWDDPFIALVYELSRGANATLVLENVFDMLTDAPDPETGTWGDFIKPLVDGTIPVSGPYKPSLLNRKITLQSHSLGMDSVGFYVARPEQKVLTSLWSLQQPLNFSVWLGMALAIISTFVTLRLLISLIEARKRAKMGELEKKPENFILFASLVGVLLDQSGYSSTLLAWFEATRNSNTNSDRIHHMAKLNMGFWFLGIIVISSLYKSRFITLMTLPQYESIPTNFPSLVQTDYEYGAILWADLIKQGFSALKNNSVAHALLDRVEEFSYTESECYRRIFTGKKVCIGLKRIMEMLGLQYLVDVHGQQLAVLSSDSYFVTTGTMGVSEQFPEILDLLDFVIQSLEVTGITDMWMKNKIARQIWKGKNNAKMYVENSLGPGKDLNGVYFGQSLVDSSAKQVTWLSCKLLAFGTTSSIILFFSEIVSCQIFPRVMKESF